MGQEMRLLTLNRISPATGRAGRRGMDILGAAVTLFTPGFYFRVIWRITGELLPLPAPSSFAITRYSIRGSRDVKNSGI